MVSIMRINYIPIAMNKGENLLGYTTFAEVYLIILRYCSKNLFGNYQLNNVTKTVREHVTNVSFSGESPFLSFFFKCY